MSRYITIGVLFLFLSKKKYFFFSSFILLFFVSAYRDISVGVDTQNYLDNFLGKEFQSVKGVEFGWSVLNILVYNMCNNFRAIIIISSFLFLCPSFFSIYRKSSNYFFSLFILIALYFYMNSFNIMRQSIGMSFVFLGFTYLEDGRRKMYLFMVILATLFHSTAIFLFLLMFANLKKINIRKIVIPLLVVTYFVGSLNLISPALTFISNNIGLYAIYAENINLEGQSFSLTRMMLNLFTILLLFTIKEEGNHYYFTLFLIGVLILNLFSATPFIARISQYFLIVQIILLPNVYHSIQNKKNKILTFFAITIYSTTTFIYLLVNNVSGIIPYKSILFK